MRMKMKKAIGIYREVVYAGKPKEDIEIANSTCKELKKIGFSVKMIKPEEIKKNYETDVIFTMARGKKVCSILAEYERKGIPVINSPEAIQITLNRWKAYELAKSKKVNVPRMELINLTGLTSLSDLMKLRMKKMRKKYVLKRPDRHEFTVVISNLEELINALENYKQQGLKKIIKQEFIEGRHVKYYGIGEKIYLAEDVEEFIANKIKGQALRAAKAIGLLVYGGDVIVKDDNVYLVDINDWPSFSSIREIAAKEIAKLIAGKVGE